MNFKEFLIEATKPVKNEVDIIYQSILDNLDDGHIDMNDTKLSFNIGKIMKNSKYNGLDFVVRVGKKAATRLGKDKNGKSALVVDTKGKIPSRQTIISFLNSARYSDKIKTMITSYLDKHHDYDAEVTPATDYEKTKVINTEFEDGYANLIKAIDKRIENHNAAKGHLTDKHDKTANVAQREIAQAAMRKLFDEEIGGTFEAFKSIALKLPEAEFIKKLAPEAKKKVLARLESYYDHKAEQFASDDAPSGEKEKKEE